MQPEMEITEETHSFFLDEGTHHLANLVLAMIDYVQYEYPAAYKQAVLAQFPNLFEEASKLSEFMRETTFLDGIELTDKDVYTLYTCYDLMGRLFVSSLYDQVMDGLMEVKTEPFLPEVMKKIYKHSLSNIQPFLVATELYAKKEKKLPMLGFIKKRLGNLPALA
mgnify:CR=1 FL=1